MTKKKIIRRKDIRRSANPLMGFRADAMTRAAIVKWAKAQPDKPTLSEAVQQLVGVGLSVKARFRQASLPRADSANAMAAHQLDRLADPSATAEERATRKRRLLRGPEEFRNIRVDRPKASSTR